MEKQEMCCCGNAVQHAMDILPGKQEMGRVAELFKLFGDGTRVGILCALSRHELCVSELSEVVGMSVSAVSHQLRLLRQMGLLRSRRAGKSVMYAIADSRVEEIFSLALHYSEDEHER